MAIGGLRWRLRRADIIRNPAVLIELRKLEEQVTAQLDSAGQNRGRHRSRAGGIPGRPGRQIGDACGFDLKPDPQAASTAAGLITALWQYKAWSGEPSWRRMAAQAGQTVVHSTMYAAMNGTTLPRLEVVLAIVTGCGGGEDDQKAFATAWRRIRSGAAGDTAPGSGFLAAPVPALHLVSAVEQA